MPTENCSSDWDPPPLCARLVPCASSKRRRISQAQEGNSPDPISKLGDDVLVQILIRLPDPRSASRCRCVCKRWSSLIFSPDFNRLFVPRHMSRNSEPPLLLHSFDYYLSILLTFVPVPPGVETDFCVCDSFEDLVLCGFDEADGPNGEFGRTFFICNPFTKLWVALPLAPTRPEGYFQMEARLVCEPRQSIDLDLVVYSEYRFRVVCMYLLRQSIYLDVFCSESREWTSRALVLDGFLRLRDPHLISWNGELVWGCRRAEAGAAPQLVRFNPFRPDLPPTCTDVSQLLPRRWNISVSQGAFHIFELDAKADCVRARVWRLEKEEDRRECWSHYQVSVKAFVSWRDNDFQLERCSVIGLHPANPGIVLLYYPRYGGEMGDNEIVTCDLSSGELAHFYRPVSTLRIFQPAVSCWPSPIPRYKELQGMYAGSYKCWVQRGGQVPTPFKRVLDLLRVNRKTPELLLGR